MYEEIMAHKLLSESDIPWEPTSMAENYIHDRYARRHRAVDKKYTLIMHLQKHTTCMCIHKNVYDQAIDVINKMTE